MVEAEVHHSGDDAVAIQARLEKHTETSHQIGINSFEITNRTCQIHHKTATPGASDVAI